MEHILRTVIQTMIKTHDVSKFIAGLDRALEDNLFSYSYSYINPLYTDRLPLLNVG